MTQPHAVVLSGTGRYSDPWHPFPETSARIADILAEIGLDTDVVPTTPEAVAGLDEMHLLVVDAGGGNAVDGPDPEWADAYARLEALLAGGVSLLGIHAGANTFTDLPAYRAALGGRWVPGLSFHPERGAATWQPIGHHPIVAGLGPLTSHDDERYSALEVAPGGTALLTHVEEGITHLSGWAREDDRGRAVYDSLGHHGPSYDAPDRAELLRREVAWLLRP